MVSLHGRGWLVESQLFKIWVGSTKHRPVYALFTYPMGRVLKRVLQRVSMHLNPFTGEMGHCSARCPASRAISNGRAALGSQQGVDTPPAMPHSGIVFINYDDVLQALF